MPLPTDPESFDALGFHDDKTVLKQHGGDVKLVIRELKRWGEAIAGKGNFQLEIDVDSATRCYCIMYDVDGKRIYKGITWEAGRTEEETRRNCRALKDRLREKQLMVRQMKTHEPRDFEDMLEMLAGSRQADWVPLQCEHCRSMPGFGPAPKLKRCSGCKRAWYCSVNCQRADWKNHKINCER